MKVPYKPVLASVAVLLAVTAIVILLPTHKATPATHSDPPVPTVPVVPVETAPVASEVFTLVNTERSKAGLAPLVEDTRLDTAAAAKCADMAARNYWSHYTPEGTPPWQFVHKAGVSYLKAAENLEYGYTTSSNVVIGWMNSPGHRGNILNGYYNDVGTATCHADTYRGVSNQYIVVQEFAQE